MAKPTQHVPDADSIQSFRNRPTVWLTFAGAAALSAYSDLLRPHGLKPVWVTALAIIAERPGISQSALGRALTINRASSMALANLLQEAGLISRQTKAGRPLIAIWLTDAGRQKLDTACALETNLAAEIMAFIGEERLAGFIETLKQIVGNVNGSGSSGSR